MVKALQTLIRLHKRQLDELKRQQAELDREREALMAAHDRLEVELAVEAAQTEQQPTLSRFFAQYAKKVRERQRLLLAEVARVDKALAEVAEKITEGFGELKKFEIARDNELSRRHVAAEKRDQQALDATAIDRFSRKGK
jgi:uncharacterized protein (UPF0335 family)